MADDTALHANCSYPQPGHQHGGPSHALPFLSGQEYVGRQFDDLQRVLDGARAFVQTLPDDVAARTCIRSTTTVFIQLEWFRPGGCLELAFVAHDQVHYRFVACSSSSSQVAEPDDGPESWCEGDLPMTFASAIRELITQFVRSDCERKN